jgi:uncharacterized protein (DUF305 family)
MSVSMRVAAVLVALCTVLSACSGSSSTSPHADHTATHNEHDVTFARNMIPHHQQAIELSAMVPTNTTNHDVIIMAQHISEDQRAEIGVLEELLAQWGEELPPEHGAHDRHAAMGIEGMVDAATMNQLQSLRGTAFDELWLRSMIHHHQGAITMAQAEMARGQNPDAVKKAKIIVDSQQLEIAQMNHLLTVPE